MLSSHFYIHVHIHSHIAYSLGYIDRKQCLYKDLTHEKEREVILLQGTAHFLCMGIMIGRIQNIDE